jgi:NADH-quinone oxidoreductase subunit M
MLSLLLLTPLVGSLVLALLPQRLGAWVRRTAIAAALLALAQVAWLLWRFDPAGDFQFFETHAWNPRLGTALSLAVDGLALGLVLLAAILFVAAFVAFRIPAGTARLYYLLMLVLESAVFGVFMARDWSLFYVFWELTLIPLFFLIERLGGPQRQRAALNFVLYTLGGSVFMLVALLLLYDAVAAHSFDMAVLATGGSALANETQTLIFLGLFLGFAVKMGVFPLHGWMPLVYREAPAAVPLVSSGVLLKMGAYGTLRAVEMLPGAAVALHNSLSWLALASLLYGAVLAWQSRDLLAMATYASISHMAVVLLGAATLAPTGFSGAALQMLAHGLAAGALFLLIGLWRERREVSAAGSDDDLCDTDGTHAIRVAHEGLALRFPRMGTLLVLVLLLGLGLPGSFGFVAEVHVLSAGFAEWGGRVALISLAVLIGAAWVLREIACMTDTSRMIESAGVDLRRIDTAVIAALIVLLIGCGVAPGGVLALVGGTSQRMAQLFVGLL